MLNFKDPRAAIGTAETPAAPISGLTFVFEQRFMSFAIKTPAAVASEKATTPSIRINSV